MSYYRGTTGLLLVLVISVSILVWLRFRDRHPGYSVSLDLQAPVGEMLVGFAKRSINPSLVETWTDINLDGRYRPDDGDFYTDVNENDRFDPIWMAGFHNQRAAQGIHDTLWARTFLLERDEHKMALCAIDAIGFWG